MELETNISFGEQTISENLKVYLKNNFLTNKKQIQNRKINKDQDLFWKKNIGECSIEEKSNFNILKICFPQLNFPIKIDIEKSVNYRDATLRGKTVQQSIPLLNEEDLHVEYYNSFAGLIVVLTIQNEEGFIKLIQALCYKNNPIALPKSMGASFINGINNWGKINSLKKEFLKENLSGEWNKKFSTEILTKPNLYKDKLIVLSAKPYSNIPANILGLSESLWKEYSLLIRKNHEFTHFYTLQKYGSATGNLHDELIADYIGIIKTLGYYNKTWMLTFMGLENFPEYRIGARLENYLKFSNKLNAEEFKIVLEIVKNAIENIAAFDKYVGKIKSEEDLYHRIDSLCETNLRDVAAKNGTTLLLNKYIILSKEQN